MHNLLWSTLCCISFSSIALAFPKSSYNRSSYLKYFLSCTFVTCPLLIYLGPKVTSHLLSSRIVTGLRFNINVSLLLLKQNHMKRQNLDLKITFILLARALLNIINFPYFVWLWDKIAPGQSADTMQYLILYAVIYVRNKKVKVLYVCNTG